MYLYWNRIPSTYVHDFFSNLKKEMRTICVSISVPLWDSWEYWSQAILNSHPISALLLQPVYSLNWYILTKMEKFLFAIFGHVWLILYTPCSNWHWKLKKGTKSFDHSDFFFKYWTKIFPKNWIFLVSPFWGLVYITLYHYIEIGRFGQSQ